MSAENIPALIRVNVSKDQMIDLASLFPECRRDAAKAVEVTPLVGKARARVVGYASHEITEQRLAEVIQLHEGRVIEGQAFPGTKLRNYQVLGVYGRVLIGKASIVEAGALPTRNLTRSNGAKFNRSFSKKADIPGLFVPPPDGGFLYVTFLTCRDRYDMGKFHEIAVTVIESDFSGFAFYEEIDAFIASYGEGSGDALTPSAPAPDGPQPLSIELRKDVKPFIGGEVRVSQNESDGNGDA